MSRGPKDFGAKDMLGEAFRVKAAVAAMNGGVTLRKWRFNIGLTWFNMV